MVELDAAVTAMMGLDLHGIGHLRAAAEISGRRLPSAGDIGTLREHGFAFSPAGAVMRVGRCLSVYPTTSCSRRTTALSEAGRSMRSSVWGAVRLAVASWLGSPKSLVIGKARPSDAPSGKVLCIGRCASESLRGERRVDACPPTASEVEQFLRRHL